MQANKSNKSNQLIIAIVIVALLLLAGVGYALYVKNTNDDQPSSGESSSQESTHSNTPKNSTSEDSPKKGSDTQGSEITAKEAEDIALKAYGGDVKSTESDHYKGTPAWEVEIRHSDKGRIEVKVDKATGKILNEEQDS